MTSILTDSMAREHAAELHAAAATSRRVREARQARRGTRRDSRRTAPADRRHGGRVAAAGRAASRPLAVFHHWLAAGQL